MKKNNDMGFNEEAESTAILKRIELDGYVVMAMQHGMNIDGTRTDPDAQLYVIPDNAIKLYYNDTIRYLTIWKRDTTGYNILMKNFRRRSLRFRSL